MNSIKNLYYDHNRKLEQDRIKAQIELTIVRKVSYLYAQK